MKLDNEQIQRILDSYSVGTLESFIQFGETIIPTRENMALTIYFVKTTHGMYCLVGGTDSDITLKFLKISREKMIQEIAETVGLKNSEVLLTQPQPYPGTHKFDYKFFLFRL